MDKNIVANAIFDSSKLDKYLICNVTDATVIAGAPKAYCNKKQGYKLWREGYVKNVEVKPYLSAYIYLFIVRASVYASMKSCQYRV